MINRRGWREERGHLSDRERVIAERYAAGLSYKQIATELFIAPTTVRGHLSTIYRKLHIHEKTELTRLFADGGESADDGVVVSPALDPQPPPTAPTPPPVTTAARFSLRPSPALGIIVFLTTVGAALVWVKPWEPREGEMSTKRAALPLPHKPSIAVLPFTNMSDDSTQDHFANGFTDDLITDLSKVSGLFVIARNSTFAYKDREVTVRQIAEDLGVRYVLEGSVRRSEDMVRVNAQLIDAATGGHVWAERYDGYANDIFAVQDEFVREIVDALALNLSEMEVKQIGRGQTSNLAAREAFQRGWELYLRFTQEGNTRSAAHFKRATELDPAYGRAYAALSLVYLRALDWAWTEPLHLTKRQTLNTAAAYLDTAKRYPTALAHVSAAKIALAFERHPEAFEEAALAVSLDPNEPEAHIALAWVMVTTGKPEVGLKFVETAIRLDPRHPGHYAMAHGMAFFALGHLRHAARLFEAALERDPGAVQLAAPLAAAYAHLGERQQARAALLRWKPVARQVEVENLPDSYYFPYRWPSERRENFDRLYDGLHIAALPLDTTVPTLVETLRVGNPWERSRALRALGWFGQAAKTAVPALIAALEDKDERRDAVIALGKIGPGAKAAIPSLQAMQDQSLVGHYATRALVDITRTRASKQEP